MIKKLKSNKIIVFLLLFVCIVFIINPVVYTKSALNAISVWSFKLLPVLFPFFVITRLIVNLISNSTSSMDKVFYKLYNTRNSATVYFLSVLSGYPMGAKLICNMYELNRIDKNEAQKMFSFCSVSGPMFIVGTVGVAIFNSYQAGVIMLIANIAASLINGLIYRGKKSQNKQVEYVGKQANGNLLFDCVYDSMQSILMVGAFIIISFLIIDILNNLHIISFITNIICTIFNCKEHAGSISASIIGLVEMTRGIIDLSALSLALKYKAIIASTLIAFGGVSIFMQSLGFLSKLNMPKKLMILQKTTQAILCLIISVPLCLIFL